MGGDQTLLEPSKLTESSSSGNIQNSPQIAELLSTSDKAVDTIEVEVELKLLPSTFCGINQEDLESLP